MSAHRGSWERLPPGLAALGYRDYRLIWTGQVVSNIGSSMQQLGLGWLIVQLADAEGTPQLVPIYLGLVGLARGIPVVFAGLAAGVIADRVDRRKLLLSVQIYWAIVSTTLAWLTLSGRITFPMVLILTVLTSIAMAFDGATRQAVFPRLVPRKAMVSAIGLNSMSFNVAQFIGPMIGGFLIVPLGVGGLMALNSLSFLALIFAIWASSPLPVEAGASKASPLRSLSDSFSFVMREPTVRAAMILSLIGNVLARPFQLLLPAFVYEVLQGSAQDLSYIMTAAGIGALSGAFATASLGSFRHRGVLYCVSGMLMGGFLTLFGVQQSLAITIVLAFCVAASAQFFITMSNALYHIHTPDVLRGRVMGLATVVVQGGMSMGSLFLGAIGAVVGIGTAMAAGGGLFATASGIALARVPALRDEPTGGRDESIGPPVAAREDVPRPRPRPATVERG
jgi:predicted MFS family arabinose efflux permease